MSMERLEALRAKKRIAELRAKRDGTPPPESKREYSPLVSGLQGAADTMSFGFDDELGGAATAIAKDLFGDGGNYEAERDKIRASKKSLQEANPGSYLTGGLVAGIAAPGGVASKAASLGGRAAVGAATGAAQGGAQGFGSSDEEAFLDQLADGAQGAAIGGALGGVTGGLLKPKEVAQVGSRAVDAGKGLVDSTKSKLSVGADAFKESAKEVADIGFGTGALKTVTGLKGAAKALIEQKSNTAEFKQMIDGFRQHLGPGSRHDFSDEEVLTMLLMKDGPNQAKQWVASSASHASGGGIAKDDYLSLLDKSPDTTKAQRLFNKQDAGAALTGDVQKAYDDLTSATGEKYGSLKASARSQFGQVANEPVRVISEAMAYAQSRKSISGSVNNQLSDVFSDLVGDGTAGFQKLSPEEQFDRILSAKQAVGKAVKWAGKNEPPESQQILQDVYGKLGSFLKKFDDMQEADAAYSTFKDIEKNVFKPIADVKQGKIVGFDPIKLEKVFGQSDSGRRLLTQIEKAKEKLASGELGEGESKKLSSMITSLEEMVSKADGQRQLNAFRQRTAGPSGPAIERLGAGIRKDTPIDSAIRTPYTFLQSRENIVEGAEHAFGKPFGKLNETEQKALIRLHFWRSANQKATPAQAESRWRDIKKELDLLSQDRPS